MPASSDVAHLNSYDLAVFAGYMALTVAVGFWAARGMRSRSKQYFLGDKAMPWYVVGASMVSTNISSEHFVGNVRAAYNHGAVVATGGWNAWITYYLLIWIFLPYYIRSGIYTMPQFLEKRYNSACRTIFAMSLIVGYVAAILGGTLYAGALSLQRMLNMDLTWAIIFFGGTTGAYTVYGGRGA